MVLLWTVRATTAVRMPKEMINVTVQRKQGEPWGMVIVGGKDQALTVKLGRIKVTIIITLFLMDLCHLFSICRLTAPLSTPVSRSGITSGASTARRCSR